MALAPSTGTRRDKKAHEWTIKRLYGKDQNSPLWKGTICRTIPEWNRLGREIVSAGSTDSFKSRLSGAKP